MTGETWNGIFWRLRTGAPWADIPPRYGPHTTCVHRFIERFFSKLKHFLAIATRYDKRDDNFLASVQFASIRIWLQHNESVA